MHSPSVYVPGAVVEYCGATDTRGSVWRATIRRGNTAADKFRATVPFEDGPDAAARAVVERFNRALAADWQLIGAALSLDGGDRYAYPVGSAELATAVAVGYRPL
jgi:hypothetical protein